MSPRCQVILCCIAAGIALPGPGYANTTTNYLYDALGRVVAATTAGTANTNSQITVTYDSADNRTKYVVTGSKAIGVVVVPINGLTVIPLPDN